MKNRIGMKLTVLAAASALAVLAVLAAATTAGAAGSLTGTWYGKTSQELDLTDVEWNARISVAALNGRILTLVTSARVECPGPAVADIRVMKSWRSGTGPLLGKQGTFAVRVSGVSISGSLGTGRASGRFDVSKGGCSGKGSWKARRVL